LYRFHMGDWRICWLMSELVPEDRKALGVYPVWLFYVAIAWMILIS